MKFLKNKKYILLLCFLVFVPTMFAQETPLPFPKIGIDIGKSSKPEDVSVTLQILFLMTILSLAPALMILTTAFSRIVIVMHFVKQSLGTQQVPPSQILVGISLFLTFFIMAPTWKEANDKGLQPYLKNEISLNEAYDRGIVPIRSFMFKHTKEEDLELFVQMSESNRPKSKEEVSTYVLIPAFALSELKVAFEIGFMLFIPFLVIDMVVASVLMSMGMMMLPPVIISLPFKLLLFVLVDGWHLIVQSLVQSFR